MRYLWEVYLQAVEEGVPAESVVLFHDPGGSAYMELALPELNRIAVARGMEIGVNTYYRFYRIFREMFGPELKTFPDLRRSMTNVILHALAENDIRMGMTKEEYHKKLLAEDTRAGVFGKTAQQVFAALEKERQHRLLSGWLRSYRVGSAVEIFTDMIHGLIDDSIVYHNNDCPDQIMIYTGLPKTQQLEEKLQFLIDLFLDIRYETEIFYEHHFGIIGMDNTMQVDEIALY